MQRQVVLMVALGRIERPAGLDGGDDLGAEHLRLVELLDIGLGDLGLRLGRREDGRAILRADIRALAVELGRIVRDREIDLQQAAEAHLARIVGHAHRFGVPGAAAADLLVLRGRLLAAGIAGHRAGHAVDVLEHALHAPEAAAGENDGRRRGLAGRLVERRRGKDVRGLGGRRRDAELDAANATRPMTARAGTTRDANIVLALRAQEFVEGVLVVGMPARQRRPVLA